MSLQTRLEALAAALGADVKALQGQPNRLTEELSEGIIWIGHRGGPLRYPENGMKGLRRCAEDGFMVETDVRATSDDQLVIMHDASLDRTTTLTGNVRSTTYANVRKGMVLPPNPGMSAEPIPNWREVLDMAHETNAIFIPETKDGLAITRNTMINDMKARRMEKQAVPCSFDLNDCIAFAQAGFQTSFVTGNTATNWQSVWNQGIRWTSINIANFSQAQVAAIKAIGFKVLGWTTDTYAQGQSAISKGCHGVISDDPWLGSLRMNPKAHMDLDGSLPAHFVNRDTGTDVQTTKDLSSLGWRWAGDKVIQRRGVGVTAPVQAIDLGFTARKLPVIRLRGRHLPGAVAQDRWFGVAWAETPDPDAVFDDNFLPGQIGYSFILRRTGIFEVFHKSETATNDVGTISAPTPNITTATSGTSAWQDLEIRFTATQIIMENKTTGQSGTFTNNAYRGEGRLFLVSRNSDFEIDLEHLTFASQ